MPITLNEITHRQTILEASTTLSATLQNGAFIQWSTKRQQLNNINGKGTFHGVGVVAVLTSPGSFSQLTQITKFKEKKPVAEIVKDRGVPIFNYNGPATLESFPKISPLKILKV